MANGEFPLGAKIYVRESVFAAPPPVHATPTCTVTRAGAISAGEWSSFSETIQEGMQLMDRGIVYRALKTHQKQECATHPNGLSIDCPALWQKLSSPLGLCE